MQTTSQTVKKHSPSIRSLLRSFDQKSAHREIKDSLLQMINTTLTRLCGRASDCMHHIYRDGILTYQFSLPLQHDDHMIMECVFTREERDVFIQIECMGNVREPHKYGSPLATAVSFWKSKRLLAINCTEMLLRQSLCKIYGAQDEELVFLFPRYYQWQGNGLVGHDLSKYVIDYAAATFVGHPEWVRLVANIALYYNEYDQKSYQFDSVKDDFLDELIEQADAIDTMLKEEYPYAVSIREMIAHMDILLRDKQQERLSTAV